MLMLSQNSGGQSNRRDSRERRAHGNSACGLTGGPATSIVPASPVHHLFPEKAKNTYIP